MAQGDAEIRIQAGGADELKRVSMALKRAGGGELQRLLNRNLRDAGRPVIGNIRMAVMGVQVSSTKGGAGRPHYSRNLRSRTASAVRMSIAARGIRFGVESSRIGAGRYSQALVKYLDSELPGYGNWRHPVFGHDVWTVQHGQPWFFETIRQHAADFEDACVRAMNEVLDHVGRGL